MYATKQALCAAIAAAIAALLATGCGDDSRDPGDLAVAVYGEEFIEEGIPSAEFVDAWAVSFDAFVVDVGEVTVASGDEPPAIDASAFDQFDLVQATGGAGQLVVEKAVPGGVYDRVSYQIRSIRATGSARKDGVVKTFDWTFDRPTEYASCEGTAVVDGGAAATQLTIHADHLFYDDLVSSEPNVAFDLIAAADADEDGEVTSAELAAMGITPLERYQVGNATGVTDLWSFIDAQAATVGHIDGEGHCPESRRL